MIFKHHLPEIPLDNFVASIVYYKDFKVEHSKDKLLPDCTTNLVVNLFETPRYIYDNVTLEEKEACYEAWFSGMHTEYLTISSDNESEMLVISFKAGGVYPFINQSVETFNNAIVHAKTVFGDEVLDLRQRLINERDPDKKIELAKKWLLSRLDKVSFEGEIIQQFVSQIQKTPENINITELAKKSGYSQKQFIHLFKKYVGLTPKQFHRIVRFNEILNAIFNKEKVDWAAFANEFGYYDQAHFIKDFQAYSGHNPKQYIDDQGDWPTYIPVSKFFTIHYLCTFIHLITIKFNKMKIQYLILIVTVVACKSEPKEVENPYHYKIAYNVLYDDEADDYEVFIMDLDGKNQKNITNLGGVEWTYYAYDDEVYYISDKDTVHRNYFLYKMKADGSKKTKISNIRLADSWHSSRKSGSEFIVKPHRSIDTAFYIIDANGKMIHRLKPKLDMFNDPLFSPNGEQIVFRGGNKSTKFERGFDDELYIMNADGSNMKQLTHFPENDTLKKWHSYAAGPPRWNTKENFITYQSERNGQYNLFAVTPDGNKNWRLTTNTFSEGWHDWSPDGNYIAIEAFDKEQTQFDIYLMNWETKETIKLTDSTYKYQQAPVFVKVYE